MPKIFRNLPLLFCGWISAIGLGGCASESATDSTSDLQDEAHISVLFTGDICYGESYGSGERVLDEHGYSFPSERIEFLMEDHDLIVANLETPLTTLRESPFAESKNWCHWSDVEGTGAALESLGVDAVSLANNHTLDMGVDGLRETELALRQRGIASYGAGENLEESSRVLLREWPLGTDTFRLAVIMAFEYRANYDADYAFYASEDRPGVRALDIGSIVKQIQELKAEDPNTYVIVFPHWGKNYAWRSKAQRAHAQTLLNSGADFILGHGSHALQELDFMDSKGILYGLGNFLFLSPGRYADHHIPPYSMVANFKISGQPKDPNLELQLWPIHTDNKTNSYQPRPLNPGEFDHFFKLWLRKSALNDSDRSRVRRKSTPTGSYVSIALNH